MNPHLRIGPRFPDRHTAEHVVAIASTTSSASVDLAPVWQIDHDDLLSSKIVAWTVTEELN